MKETHKMAFGSIIIEDVKDAAGQALVSVKVEMSGDFETTSNAHQQIGLLIAHLDSINVAQPASDEPLLKE